MKYNVDQNSRYREEQNFFAKANESLSGKWAPAIIASIIIGITSVISGIIPFGAIVIGGPLYLGAAIWVLKFVHNQDFQYDDLFAGFNNFGNALVLLLLKFLIVMGLTLLFIIPGIIGALALSQSFFIMAEDPNIKPSDALRKSHEMMDGHKGELFIIFLKFFLLGLACIMTLGFGFLFLIPYTRIVLTHFYISLRPETREMTEIDHLVTN